MIIALDKDGKRVHINQTYVKYDYFCPLCGEKLILKKGQIRRHHFAHRGYSTCTDHWHYDMSEWHQEWQNLFPIDCQEVVLTCNGVKHIADVLVDKTIIEFQHSYLSCEEFDERNSFYTSLGFRVIWIFDLCEEFDTGKIEELPKRDFVYRWKHPKQTFNKFNVKRKDVLLFFEFGLADEGEPTESKYIVKVNWTPDNGFERFAIDMHEYDEKSFIEFVSPSSLPPSKKYTLEDVCNDMRNEHCIGAYEHSHLFHGCPLSKSGLATSFGEGQELGYGCCNGCKHYKDYCKCKYPLDYLNIPAEAEIKDIKHDDFGLIKTVIYKYNGETIEGNLPEKDYSTKNIYELWNELSNPLVATFYNLRTGFFVRLYQNPSKYPKVYGYLSSDQYSFNRQSTQIFYCSKKEWIYIWHKSKE